MEGHLSGGGDRERAVCDERGVPMGTSFTSVSRSAPAPAPVATVRMETTRTCPTGHMFDNARRVELRTGRSSSAYSPALWFFFS